MPCDCNIRELPSHGGHICERKYGIHLEEREGIQTSSKGRVYLLNTGHVWNYVRFEVFTAVTMKNVVFWDIKTQFVLHRRHVTSPLQNLVS
jgi:hypothetical protein